MPAIVRYPAALPAGEVRDQAVTAMDWMPTVLELCGIEPTPGVTHDGRSLLPVIREAGSPSPHPVLHWGWRGGWAVREGDWKLIGTGDKAEFLGNLAEPEPERTNHLEQRPELVRRLIGLHEAWAKEVRPQPCNVPGSVILLLLAYPNPAPTTTLPLSYHSAPRHSSTVISAIGTGLGIDLISLPDINTYNPENPRKINELRPFHFYHTFVIVGPPPILYFSPL